jgi:hypothetical protein
VFLGLAFCAIIGLGVYYTLRKSPSPLRGLCVLLLVFGRLDWFLVVFVQALVAYLLFAFNPMCVVTLHPA